MTTQTTENRERLLVIWLIVSAFGIMFAVLSWMQESGAIPPVDELGAWKGFLAVVTGLVLYWFVARNIPGGPGDE
jgi:ABC-type transport system involved in cytochrome c biogenesis permease subunit